HAAAKRVRQLRDGAERLVNAPENEDIVAALREIAAGKVFVTQHYTEYQENGAGEPGQGQEEESGSESAS
ncbi:MAG: DNA-directed RNA polymerase subunit omega, partial [Desulfosalsimonas sp.]